MEGLAGCLFGAPCFIMQELFIQAFNRLLERFDLVVEQLTRIADALEKD